MTTSTMLQAIDLTRVNVDAMTLEELQAHAMDVLDTIGALNECINSPAPKSANAKLNVLRLANKLRLHMAHVRDLINAYQAAVALVGAAQAAGSANLAQGATVFGP
jgi:hypothetical protein